MGCECSSESSSGKELRSAQTDLLAYSPSQLTQHLHPNYFILITEYGQYYANYEATLKQSFPQLNFKRSKVELEQYRKDDKNNVLIICCKNINQIKQARKLANFHTFNKIGVAYNFDIPNIDQVKSSLQREMGFRFKSIFRDSVEEIKQFFKNSQSKSSLYFCHKNMGLINRTLLLFHYFFRQDYNHDKNKFLNWLMTKENGNALVEMIEANSDSEQSVELFLVNSLFSESVLLKQAIELLGSTMNPGVLINISWFISVIFKHIKNSYDSTLKTNKAHQFVVWIQLTPQEVETLKTSQGENFMFSTFVIGQADKYYIPNQAKKSKNWYKIYINLPKELTKNDREVDLGFYIHQNKVIFNIFNMYSLDSISLQDKSLTITYSSLGIQYNLRKTDFRYYKDAKKSNIRMIKLYDYFCLNKMQVSDIFDLVYMLQMYQKYKQIATIQYTQSKKANNESVSTRTNSSIDSFENKLSEYLGDCEYQTLNQDRAISYYKNVYPQERGLIKMLYLYHQKSVGTQFRQTIQTLIGLQSKRPITDYGRLAKIAFNNFSARMSCRSGDYKQASKKINQTISQLSQPLQKYNLHNESYTSFPIYSLIQRTAASIANFMGEKDQAQLIDKQCGTNELMFDGVHKIWLQRQSI